MCHCADVRAGRQSARDNPAHKPGDRPEAHQWCCGGRHGRPHRRSRIFLRTPQPNPCAGSRSMRRKNEATGCPVRRHGGIAVPSFLPAQVLTQEPIVVTATRTARNGGRHARLGHRDHAREHRAHTGEERRRAARRRSRSRYHCQRRLRQEHEHLPARHQLGPYAGAD